MAIISRLWGYLVVVAVAAAAVFGVYLSGRSVGKAKAETKAAEQRAAEIVETAKQVNEAENQKLDKVNETLNEVNALPDGDAVKQLHDQWSRD